MAEEHRLEDVLTHVRHRRWRLAEPANPGLGIVVEAEDAEISAHESIHPPHERSVRRARSEVADGLVIDPEAATDLEGTSRDRVRLWAVMQRWALLHDAEVDALLFE